MTPGVEHSLPHGTIPYQHITDANVRDVVMKVNENIKSLHRTDMAILSALKELQRKAVKNG